ncbi:predicted protein [Sclerotinia sclerotiorum 1980 UF-70]|uniref:Uncharacterized protein n=1 Tax=Sclerotinia sclerotiorum (strain ATCC 18683 / 1980 / Ss-1) TaxID=665079 RepID=A7ESG3_SCLS1|nr:predicted protein [Sclerotinia sclerotiorum 1980 UF-70]EDN92405.1 predicted protein [Sclerotinia sclerotiorum 1980 UF-70]
MSASQVRVAVRAGRDEAEVYGMEWNGMCEGVQEEMSRAVQLKEKDPSKCAISAG